MACTTFYTPGIQWDTSAVYGPAGAYVRVLAVGMCLLMQVGMYRLKELGMAFHCASVTAPTR